MVTVDTPDGQVIIFDHRDAIDLAEQYIGHEYANYIANKIVEFDEAEWRNAQEWASDYHAMEAENEEYRDELYEVKSQLEQLSYNADINGLSKRKIIEEVDKIWDRIQKIL